MLLYIHYRQTLFFGLVIDKYRVFIQSILKQVFNMVF